MTDRDESDNLRVEFGPPKHGSMLVKVETGSISLGIWASYIPHDSISALASALALILKGGEDAVVVWNEEPTEYDFRFSTEGVAATLIVEQYPDHRRSKKGGTIMLTLSGTRHGVCLPFWRAFQRLRSKMPPNEFKAAWGRHWPEAKLVEVTTLVERAKRGRENRQGQERDQ